MLYFTLEMLENYLSGDYILKMLDNSPYSYLSRFQSDKWISSIPAKRLALSRLYHDILNNSRSLNVLEVGSGLNRILPLIAKNANLTIVDTFYDDIEIIEHPDITFPLLDCNIKVNVNTWYDYIPAQSFDLIIANDIFPNVDQRLDSFLSKYLPLCKEMRLTLTVHPDKSELVSIMRTGEHIMMQFWDHYFLYECLRPYATNILNFDDTLMPPSDSIYSNGRQVLLITLKGGL